jgi:LmbE family N-acetylglucosaminyl deacetylase
MNLGKKILVVAAHPDDEILGCGGSIIKLQKKNKSIYTVFLSNGVSSRNLKNKNKEILRRKSAAIKCNKYIKSKIIDFFDYPDNKFDTVPFLNIVKDLEKVIEKHKPDCIFTHSDSDLNIDHKITLAAVVTACRPYAYKFIKTILSFEVPSSTESNFLKKHKKFQPNYFIDISNTIKKKIKAIKIYKDELRKFPHPRSIKYIKSLSEVRGGSAGVKSAEAFEVVRHVEI